MQTGQKNGYTHFMSCLICKQYLTLHTEQPFTKLALLGWCVKRRKEKNVLFNDTYTHFIDSYMVSDIW